jgi:hypothetical protein
MHRGSCEEFRLSALPGEAERQSEICRQADFNGSNLADYLNAKSGIFAARMDDSVSH